MEKSARVNSQFFWESRNIELDSSSTSSYLYTGISKCSGNFRTTPILVYFFETCVYSIHGNPETSSSIRVRVTYTLAFSNVLVISEQLDSCLLLRNFKHMLLRL